MIVTTTPSIEGKRITQYLGVVTGETIVGANIFKDILAGIRDIVGGRSGAYEKAFRKAREIAFEEMEQEAAELGANAIVGIDIDTETVGLPRRDAHGQRQRHRRHDPMSKRLMKGENHGREVHHHRRGRNRGLVRRVLRADERLPHPDLRDA